MNDNSTSSNFSKTLAIVNKIVPFLFVFGMLGAGWYAVHELNTSTETHSDEESEGDMAESEAAVITLPEGKVNAAGFTSTPVEPQLVQHVHVVPGRIHYDELHHIEVKTPMAGILTEIRVKPGDDVAEGQLLATLNSPEIGEARAEVLKREADYELALRRSKREQEIAANLKEFMSQLDNGVSLNQLDKQFMGRPLGRYREVVQSAYSRLSLAEELNESVQPLAETGTISGRTIRERESELQIARGSYRSAREQAAFESAQSEFEAEADLKDAERMLKIARQQLESLLGYEEKQTTMDTEQSLSRVEIRAAFAGTIEARFKAESERVLPTEVLFVLANTDSLYVAADIRENDWPAISLTPGTTIQVEVPAMPDCTLTATVHYIGREVIPSTNAIPLVAKIDNREGLLRPGMFVRVALPLGQPKEALSVRPASILQQGDQDFVFESIGTNAFRKVEISTGIASDEWVEVTNGLVAGQMIVEKGAFILKSELLLEGEAE